MNTEMMVFKNEEFGEITVIEKDDDLWFVAKEIADILGYSQTSMMTKRLDDDEKADHSFWSISSNQYRKQTVINESGFYNAVIGSKKLEAKIFKKWVTGDVLPSIRKEGMYISDNATTDQKRFNFKMLETTFKSTALEELETTYADCIEYHKENKTRLKYERVSSKRKKNTLRSITDSKIMIMSCIEDTLRTRVASIKHAGYREPTVILFTDIAMAIKNIKHNKTRGKLASATFANNKTKVEEKQTHRVDCCDDILSSENTTTTIDIATEIQVSIEKLNNFLKERGILCKVDKVWYLNVKYYKKGYTDKATIMEEGNKTVTQLRWTPKGKEAVINEWYMMNPNEFIGKDMPM